MRDGGGGNGMSGDKYVTNEPSICGRTRGYFAKSRVADVAEGFDRWLWTGIPFGESFGLSRFAVMVFVVERRSK